MKYAILFAAGASAFPFAMEHIGEAWEPLPDLEPLHKRTNEELMDLESMTKRQGLTPLQVSQQETNCGPAPCTTFNAANQFVSTSGAHAYIKPKNGQIRGPCPGLNAAANHGYLDRSGIQTIQSTVQGLGDAYGFEPAFAAGLAVFSSIISGDIITERWSIGGPIPNFVNPGGLLSQPEGISFSHNRYEGDVSIGRNDAYLGHGDAYSLNVSRWEYAANHCTKNRCTLDKFRAAFLGNVYQSISENPYYFSPFLAGAVVPPAAYNFVINFMSNHTAQEPSGYLDIPQFAQFFAVSGTKGNYKWNPGQEQIPKNWYRRPKSHPYGAAQLVADDVIGWAARPASFRLGGNTNGVNSYRGIDISLLTGGAYKNPGALLQGNNAACLLYNSMSQVSSDELRGGSAVLQTAAKAAFGQYIAPLFAAMSCPQLSFDQNLYNPYPGAKYNPKCSADKPGCN